MINMKMRTAVLLGSLVLMAIVAIPAMSDHAEADGTDDGFLDSTSVSVGLNDTRVFELRFNESAFGDGYTISWSAASVGEEWKPADDTVSTVWKSLNGTAVELGDECKISISLKEGDLTDHKNVSISGKADGSMTVVLKAQITLDGSTVSLDPEYFRIGVTVSETLITIEKMELTQYVAIENGSISATLSGNKMTNSDYSWYSALLPKGLSVSSSGSVTGTPMEAGSFYVDVTATKDRTQYRGTMMIEIEENPDAQPEYPDPDDPNPDPSPGGTHTVVVNNTHVVTFDTAAGLSCDVVSNSNLRLTFTVSVTDGFTFAPGSVKVSTDGGNISEGDGVYVLSGIRSDIKVTVSGDRMYSVTYDLPEGADVTVEGYDEPPSLVKGSFEALIDFDASHTVTLIMGSADVSADYVEGDTISVPEVTGDLRITVEVEPEPAPVPDAGDEFPWWAVVAVLLAVIAVLVVYIVLSRR